MARLLQFERAYAFLWKANSQVPKPKATHGLALQAAAVLTMLGDGVDASQACIGEALLPGVPSFAAHLADARQQALAGLGTSTIDKAKKRLNALEVCPVSGSVVPFASLARGEGAVSFARDAFTFAIKPQKKFTWSSFKFALSHIGKK